MPGANPIEQAIHWSVTYFLDPIGAPERLDNYEYLYTDEYYTEGPDGVMEKQIYPGEDMQPCSELPFKFADTNGRIENVCGQWEWDKSGGRLDKGGRIHAQLYLKTKYNYPMDSVATLLFQCYTGSRPLSSNQFHIEPMYSSPEQLRSYCTDKKKASYLCDIEEYGHFIKKGTRTDLNNIKDFINNGHTIKECMETFSDNYMRLRPFINDYVRLWEERHPRDLSSMPRVEIHFGVTSSGKTEQWKLRFKIGEYYKHCSDDHRFDGYEDRQRVVIFEEFHWEKLAAKGFGLNTLLDILDKGPCPLNVRYGRRQCYADTFIFTSNTNPNNWFLNEDNETRLAFFRRVSLIRKYQAPYNSETKQMTFVDLLNRESSEPSSFSSFRE